MKKRLLSAVLALSMMFSLCPVSAFASENHTPPPVSVLAQPDAEEGESADTGTGTDGGADTQPGTETGDSTDTSITKKFTVSSDDEFINAVAEINADTSGNGVYVIEVTGDIDLTGTSSSARFFKYNTTTLLGNGTLTFRGNGIRIKEGTTLALAGNITIKSTSGTMIFVEDGTFSLSENACLDGSGSSRGIYAYPGSIVNLTGGIIKNGFNESRGGGIDLYGSIMTMENTLIQDCTSSGLGSGIYAANGSTLTMESGTIKNCTASDVYSGGGIYLDGLDGSGKRSTLIMKGGTIENCSRSGILAFNSDITISGSSTIKNCTTDEGLGGGIYADVSSSVIMDGGSIEGCTATNTLSDNEISGSYGGGILLENSSTLTMSAGTIKDCSAEYGGGICIASPTSNISSKSTVTISGGSIENCTATSEDAATYGGGVYVYDGTLNLAGGTIQDCSAKNGGGIYATESSAVNITGGAVKSCSGCNVYLDGSTTTFSMTGGSIVGGGGSWSDDDGIYLNGVTTATMTGGSIENCLRNGVYVKGGSFAMSGSCTIKHCSDSAIYGENAVISISGRSEISNCEYDGYGNGGAVYIHSGTLNLSENCVIKDCRCMQGVIYADSESTVNMTGGTIENCTSYQSDGDIGDTGGIFIRGGSTMTMKNSTIKNCSGYCGGGVYLDTGGSLIMEEGSSIENCTADQSGGGVRLEGSNAFIAGCNLTMKSGSSITGCSAKRGGGVSISNLADSQSSIADGVIICNNTASSMGSDILFSTKVLSAISDASSMKQFYHGTRNLIDGWYIDGYYDSSKVDLYLPNADGEPIDITALQADTTYCLVASYRAPSEITVSDGTARNGEGEPITSAKKGDAVHLEYTGPYTFVSWQVDGADIDGDSFTMPGHAVAVTPVVADADAQTYSITVELPDDVTFAEGETAVTVVPATAVEGREVALTFHPASLPADCGKAFGEWYVTDESGKELTVTDGKFKMPASNVTVTFTLVDTDAPAPAPASGGSGGGAGVGILIGGVAVGAVSYAVGTRLWLEHNIGFVPTDRQQLAGALWNKAGCPAPESTALYPDIAEDDADAQAAARWCVEQGLLEDYGDTFHPGDHVYRFQAIKAWNTLQDRLNAQAQTETGT